jgi:hypothetical protein
LRVLIFPNFKYKNIDMLESNQNLDAQKLTESRRKFIKNVSFASVVFLTGGIKSISAAEVFQLRNKVKLRFVVASDAHYGQVKTPYQENIENIVQQINSFHHENHLHFCVMNGDLIHNDKQFMPQVKTQIEVLKMPYYVTRGNHDMLSLEEWEQVWGTPTHHDAVVKKNALIFGDSSNEKGEYISPNLDWLENKFNEHQDQKNILLFIHIPQIVTLPSGINTPNFLSLLKKYKNIKAVFHGHDHMQDTAKVIEGVPFIYDSHIGGDWGTKYHGFRVVEIMKDNTLLTYMMNPTLKMNEFSC